MILSTRYIDSGNTYIYSHNIIDSSSFVHAEDTEIIFDLIYIHILFKRNISMMKKYVLMIKTKSH